jgi:hypothetical protein
VVTFHGAEQENASNDARRETLPPLRKDFRVA